MCVLVLLQQDDVSTNDDMDLEHGIGLFALKECWNWEDNASAAFGREWLLISEGMTGLILFEQHCNVEISKSGKVSLNKTNKQKKNPNINMSLLSSD